MTHGLWEKLGLSQSDGGILDAPWPQIDESALRQSEIELVLQINGKHRGQILVPADASKEQIEQLALRSDPAVKALQGGSAKKVIVVLGRLVNLVV